ncbi:MAG: transposase [Firmicutes bacterium HGW-Firmicutes-7]|nr:MAG: transposase [Firmicutes bacterium HGW-Firmicutes-7]
MSRKAREKSSTGIYHIMFRGINGQIIFEDYEDYAKLIETLKEYKKICGYEIYAYCFMSNHIHLLIEEGKEDLGLVFRRIGAKYVYWYNYKYKRNGHLFQDRFKSEVVENEAYFLTVLRYIHRNPISAGIEKDIEKYKWSSYNEYLDKSELCNTKYVLNIFSTDKVVAVKEYKRFNNEINNDRCLEYKKSVRINEDEAKKYILEVAKVDNTMQVQSFEKTQRDTTIKKLKDIGLSIRQIERLTGISFAIIRKI